MTETLIERAYRVSEVLVWTVEKQVMSCQTRLSDAEGMYVRGTGTLEVVERRAKSLERTQGDLDGLREAIDQFNVTLEESGLSESEYDKKRRNYARTIIRYNKTYGA